MSLSLVGKTGTGVLAHRQEPLFDLRVFRVGCHVPVCHILGNAHQQAKLVKIASCPLLSEPSLKGPPTTPFCCCKHHDRSRPMRQRREPLFQRVVRPKGRPKLSLQ